MARNLTRATNTIEGREDHDDGSNEVPSRDRSKQQPLRKLLLPLVHQRVLVKGRVVEQGSSRFVEVADVGREHEHGAHHGGGLGMSSDLHVEAVAFRSGEVRVFLSDAFRQHLSPHGVHGEVEIAVPGRTARWLPLEVESDGSYLHAQSSALPENTVMVTVRLRGSQDFMMTFPLQPKATPGI